MAPCLSPSQARRIVLACRNKHLVRDVAFVKAGWGIILLLYGGGGGGGGVVLVLVVGALRFFLFFFSSLLPRHLFLAPLYSPTCSVLGPLLSHFHPFPFCPSSRPSPACHCSPPPPPLSSLHTDKSGQTGSRQADVENSRGWLIITALKTEPNERERDDWGQFDLDGSIHLLWICN